MEVLILPSTTFFAVLQKPEAIGVPTVRNDAAFLFSVCAVTGVIAVLGLQLPGDWVSPRS